MALGSLPPWISVSPRDFLLATQAGVQAGHAIADSTQRAWEQQQQMQMDQQKLEEAATEKRQQQGALSQYRAAQLAELERGLGLQEQGLKQRTQGAAERLSLAELRAADSEKFRDLSHSLKQSEYERKKSHDEAMTAISQGRLDQAATRLNDAQNKPIYHEIAGDLYKILPDGQATKVTIPKEPTTPEAPGLLHQLGSAFGLIHDTPSAPKRIKVRGPAGQTGTVPEGANLPDGWTVQ